MFFLEHLSDNSFKEFIGKGNVVVDFWADWCGPCKMMAPVFDELEKELKNVKFAKVNVDEHGELASEASVRGIPTLILFKDGVEVDRVVGFVPKDSLKQRINNAFK